jgi:hypothetical protein
VLLGECLIGDVRLRFGERRPGDEQIHRSFAEQAKAQMQASALADKPQARKARREFRPGSAPASSWGLVSQRFPG